ncbi:hypothetical protein FisN_2Hh421 [Fistulifera solaris]|jgi:NitT/TauT family transport system substrate-binding protein|uniref:Thiamine pyrimidine synthase n=1 Tax=Fistulifera solaris TaxID=1519565 RepID=A0A1Z5KKJ7_FISSO|nr:hypothetical protein FisN_2Hh421 [Fistulifera solaris]|eukprot:GAX26645.1 hypothetical protein FisN_2Hh421 [Fistulifera solaris]
MERIRLALDWKPNVNHSGILAAIHHGWYKEAGIELELIDRELTQSAPQKVEAGLADVGLTCIVTLASYREEKDSQPLKAIASLMQEDLSSMAVLESSGIERPAQLDGKRFAACSVGGRNPTITCLIQNDGGKGDITYIQSDRVNLYETVAENKADAIWLFKNWQGAQAEAAGIKLRHFTLGDYGVPYCYPITMFTSPTFLAEHSKTLRTFLATTAKGYAWAVANPEKMVDILLEQVRDEHKDKKFLEIAFAATRPYFISSKTGSWGHMEPEKVNAYLKWRAEQGLSNGPLAVDDFVTNDLLG